MEAKSKLWYFENFNLLDTLCGKEKEELSHKTHMRNCSKKQVIYFPEDASDTIYLLKEGKVKVSRFSPDGKEIIMAILGPGEIFGEAAFSGNEKRKEIAEATEDAIVCVMQMKDMNDMLERNPKFNIQITKFIGLRLRKVQTRLESLIFKTAEERIKGLIHELSQDYGRPIAGETDMSEVKLNLTHEDLAKLTATSRQTVTSVLNDLEKKEIIKYDRKRILIKKLSQLV
jgi:CRP-like cAMP-binding protein